MGRFFAVDADETLVFVAEAGEAFEVRSTVGLDGGAFFDDGHREAHQVGRSSGLGDLEANPTELAVG